MTFEFALGWNAIVVAILAVSILAVARLPFFRRRPALRHWLWLLVLIKCVTPPLFPIPVFDADPKQDNGNEARAVELKTPEIDIAAGSQPYDLGDEVGIAGFDDSNSQPVIESNAVVLPDGFALEPTADDVSDARRSAVSFVRIAAGGIWALVTVALLLRCAVRSYRLSRLVLRADQAPDSLERIVRNAANRLGAGEVNVGVVDGRVSPMIWKDWSGATILFPKELAEQISDEQVEWIACHEIAHLIRGDQWSNMFAMFVVAFFWWHPATWFARNEMRKAQELCADETVIRSCKVSRRSYLETLLSAMDFVQLEASSSLAPASGLFEKNVVESRFRALSQGPLVHRNRWRTHGVLLLLLGALLCFPANAQVTGGTNDTSSDRGSAQPENKRSVTTNARTRESDTSDRPNAEHATKPMFLHWLKLARVDDQVTPELILSSKVAPGKPFDIILTTDNALSPKPRTGVSQSSIAGRISVKDGRHIGEIDANWNGPERFHGPFDLDVPAKASAFTWSRSSSPTCIVLSYQPSSERIIENTAKTLVALIEEQPARQSVITGQFVVPSSHRITDILDGSSGGRVFLQRSGYRLNASIGVDGDGKFEYVVQNVGDAVHADTAVYVCPTLDGFSQRSYGPFKLTRLPLDLGKLDLETGFTATIRVEDPQGQPIQGAVVQSALIELKDGTTRQTKPVLGLKGASSDAKGLLHLNHVSQVPIVLTLAKSGFVVAQRQIVPKNDATIPWTLTPGDDIVGRFVDADGKAVMGAEIHLVRSENEDTLHSDPRTAFRRDPGRTRTNRTPLAMSDGEGYFRLHTLRKGTRHWLMALHTDYRPTYFSVSVDQPLTPITLHTPIVVSGSIEGDLSTLPTRRDGQRYLRGSNLEKASGRVNSTSFYIDVDPKGQFVVTQLFPGSLSFRLPSATGTKQIKTLDVLDSLSEVVIKLE